MPKPFSAVSIPRWQPPCAYGIARRRATQPVHVGALSMEGRVLEAEELPDFIKACRRLTWCGVRPKVS